MKNNDYNNGKIAKKLFGEKIADDTIKKLNRDKERYISDYDIAIANIDYLDTLEKIHEAKKHVSNQSNNRVKIKKIKKIKTLDKDKIKKFFAGAISTFIILSVGTYVGKQAVDAFKLHNEISIAEDKMLDQFINSLNSVGITADNLEENIDNININQNELYLLFLYSNKNMDLMNKEIKKYGFENFEQYLIINGYFEINPDTSQKQANIKVWQNYCQAYLLEEYNNDTNKGVVL